VRLGNNLLFLLLLSSSLSRLTGLLHFDTVCFSSTSFVIVVLVFLPLKLQPPELRLNLWLVIAPSPRKPRASSASPLYNPRIDIVIPDLGTTKLRIV
jgi:hypothetical protein